MSESSIEIYFNNQVVKLIRKPEQIKGSTYSYVKHNSTMFLSFHFSNKVNSEEQIKLKKLSCLGFELP